MKPDNETIWRIVPSISTKYHYYYVSNYGGVKSFDLKTGKWYIKKLQYYCTGSNKRRKTPRTEVRIEICTSEKLKLHSVARMVASVFCQMPNIFATQVDHIDNNTLNNRADNLRWVTPKQNIQARDEVKRGEYVITNFQKCKFYVTQAR